MTNTNCKNMEKSDSCNSCDYCYSCDYCNSCYYCNSCNSCYSCDYCYSCDSCDYCYSCDSCDYCYSCYSCDYCYSCYSCNGLRMSEKMIFCLGEGGYESKGLGYQKSLQIFNKDVTEKEFETAKSSLNVKNFVLPIAKWVDKKDMTDAEKKNWKSYTETGGYLKTLSYRDAWKELWSKLSSEDKNFFKTFKNFDADIFEKITGIKISNESLSGKTVRVELDGVSYEAIIK